MTLENEGLLKKLIAGLERLDNEAVNDVFEVLDEARADLESKAETTGWIRYRSYGRKERWVRLSDVLKWLGPETETEKKVDRLADSLMRLAIKRKQIPPTF